MVITIHGGDNMENRYYLIIGVLFCAIVALSGCITPWSGNGTSGNGNQPPDVQGSTNVALTGPGTLIIQQGDNESLTVEGSDSQKSNVDILKSGNNLAITNRNSGGDVKFNLTVKDLESLTTTGAGEIKASELNISSLTLTANDGKMDLTGKVNTLTVTINGLGTINAKDLVAQTAIITVNGNGEATLNVVETLKAVINGIGSVTYMGNPKVDQQINGQGSVKQG